MSNRLIIRVNGKARDVFPAIKQLAEKHGDKTLIDIIRGFKNERG